jgi:hypothetical protein
MRFYPIAYGAFFGFLSLINSKIITITWSTPENLVKPSTGQETLKAISTHLQALHLAEIVPRLFHLQTSVQIKLCPPLPYDPLVKEFTVPRISGYTAIYDHDCIQKNQATVEAKWGSKPKQPEPPKSPSPPSFHGPKGLSVPEFIYELYKFYKTISKEAIEPIWLLDSDSLNSWLTSPTLSYLANPASKSHQIPPAQLMKQINAMYGVIGEKDLKNMPQAIQGALLFVLPDYSSWNPALSPKFFFNPIWWSTRFIPRSKQEITNLIKKIIDAVRKSDQLVIIHHEPTPFNFDLVTQLSQIYGEKNLISSTRVLPKTATTFQTLQFIQKAAVLVIDKRHLLGQICLLSTGFAHNIYHFQQFLPYTTSEIILFVLLTIWVLLVVGLRAYFTYKNYNSPLHEHALHFILFTILAVTPLIALNPSLWPTAASNLVYSLFEAGYGFILYGIVIMYSLAAISTFIKVIYDKYKTKKEKIEDEESSESENNSESLYLIPK